MRIRLASLSQIDVVAALVGRAYTQYVARIGRRPAPMDDDYAAKVNSDQVYVGLEGSQVVGVIVLIAEHDHLLVENVAVEPSHQGRGLGQQLMAHAESTAEQLGLSELRLYTNVAMSENLRWYPRLGYHEVDRRSAGGFNRVYFAKRIRLL